MPYVFVDGFQNGLDVRKPRVAGVPGSLWDLKNAHITRGGEIERRKKFIPKYALPSGTFGLHALGNTPYVFGSTSTPSGIPAGVTYQRLQHPTGSGTMTKLIASENFDGKIYAIAEFSDGNIYHYYNGVRVTTWDSLASSISSNNGVAAALAAKIDLDSRYIATAVGSVITITAATPGTPYTISASTINFGATPTPEVLATGSFQITGGTSSPGVNRLTSVKVNNIEILGAAVNWVTSNAATATAVAAQINSYLSSPEYTASAVGQTVTISAVAGSGASPNGFVITTTVGGNVTTGSIVNMAGGVTLNIAESITLAQTQANRIAVAEVRATASFQVTGGTNSAGVNKITSIKVDGVEVLGAAVDWISSHSATAAALATQINTFLSSPEYTAVTSGSTVIIQAAPGTGSSPNGFIVTVTVAGDVTVGNTTNMAGGVTAVTALAQIYTATIGGTFEAVDIYTITLDGTAFTVSGAAAGTGLTALTFKTKMYSTAASLLYFSAINDPKTWGTGIGASFINMASQDSGSEQLIALEVYQGNMAIFSRQSVQIWFIDPDEDRNQQLQTLRNTGTMAPRSVISFGNNDVFYLADSGIRSLRARDSSNAAFTSDVGTSVDSLVKGYMGELTDQEVADSLSIMEPTDDRYWLAMGTRIWVFSYFPGAKISAWSYYDITDDIGGSLNGLVRIGAQVYARSGNTIYTYGGDSGEEYPDDNECVVNVKFPFLTAGTPATRKPLKGFDAAVTGVWDVKVLVNPADEDESVELGRIYNTTYTDNILGLNHATTHFAPELTCSKAGRATISGVIVHYEGGEAG